MRIRTLTLLPLAALAATVSGCMTITFAGSAQPQSLGPLTLTVDACASDSPMCPSASNTISIYGVLSGQPGNPSLQVQMLFAVRLPAGAAPPDDIVASAVGNGGGTVTYRRSASYEAQLQTFEPAPAGTRWWGWISDQLGYTAAGPQAIAISFPVTLPRPADGGPLASPLHWRPVVGGRGVDDGSGLPASRAVNCGASASDFYGGFNEQGQAGTTISCVSTPDAATTRTDLGAPLIDFGVTGTSVKAPAGSSVTATFLAKRSGDPDPGTTFKLAASGGPPGASVQLDRASVSLGEDAIVPVLATVTVPPGTKLGAYPLTLTASAPGKPTRTATGTVTVQSADSGGPAGGPGAPKIQSASLTHARFRVGSRRTALAARSPRTRRAATPVGTALRVRLSEAATLAVAVQRVRAGHRVKRRCSTKAHRGPRCTATSVAGGLSRRLHAGASTIAFSGRLGKRALAPGSYRLVLQATDAAHRRSATKTLAFAIVAR